jgi:hypothetical protein
LFNFYRAREFFNHVVCPLLICLEIGFKIIGKEKQLEYSEHHNKLNQNNFPKRFPKSHTPETISVKPVYPRRIIQHHLSSLLLKPNQVPKKFSVLPVPADYPFIS